MDNLRRIEFVVPWSIWTPSVDLSGSSGILTWLQIVENLLKIPNQFQENFSIVLCFTLNLPTNQSFPSILAIEENPPCQYILIFCFFHGHMICDVIV